MKPRKITEQIYKKDWRLSDGPPDLNEFKKALNHPQFLRMSMDIDYDSYSWERTVDSIYIIVTIEREETEEEAKKRKKEDRVRSQAAKKAAETRRINQEAKELEEYERLKKKFES